MKIRSSIILVSSLVLLGGINGCGSRNAPANQDAATATVEAPKADTPKTEATPEAEAPTQIPAGDANAVWQAIDQQHAELGKAIESGKLDGVHHMAFVIRDLVAALPSRSSTLSADQQAKVQGSVKFVATLADRLDTSGDATDKAATQENYDKLTAVLKELRGNYAGVDAK
jgi:pyruvate/2-oxoglutarate dehydrogenase complex dihydrolipoamide acyltransferase (E2) component